MVRLRALILLLLALMAPAVAHAQTGVGSIDDLLRRALPEEELKLTDPVIRPDGPPTAEDLAYERRVLEAFRVAQNRQGALDGRWQVQTLNGQVLYLLMFADPNAGEARIDGAWANPRRGGVTATGLVEGITREGQDVVIAFTESGVSHRIRIAANGAGAWRGESVAGNARTPVVMMRAPGIETMALGQ